MDKLKKFSITLFIFSIIFPLILYFKINKTVGLGVFSVLFLISVISFFNKNFCSVLRRKLKNTAEFIGQKLAIITLFIIFIFAIIPTKIFSVIFKRDRLRLKNKNKDTYWLDIKKENRNWDLQY